MTKLIVAFRNSDKAPKDWQKSTGFSRNVSFLSSYASRFEEIKKLCLLKAACTHTHTHKLRHIQKHIDLHWSTGEIRSSVSIVFQNQIFRQGTFMMNVVGYPIQHNFGASPNFSIHLLQLNIYYHPRISSGTV